MSVEFDKWDPQKEDFQDKEFNSYDYGPGKYLGGNNYKNKNTVRLHVSNIPPHINEDGLRALFVKTGTVTDVWKHRTFGFAFVTMASLRDAECAIRKLNDFQIEKYKIAVKVAKKDKGNAGPMQQKKWEEEIFKTLDSANSFCKDKDEDWNNDDYCTFSALDRQPMNLCQNKGRKSSLSSIKSNDSKKHQKPCKKCGKSGNKRCSQCKTPYCSINCQQLDWFDNHHEESIQKKPGDESNAAKKATKIFSKVQLPLHESCQVLVTNVISYKDIHVQLIEEANFKLTTYLITELAKAVWCALDISPSKTSDDDDTDLLTKQEFKYDQPYRLMVIQTGEPYLVKLYDDKDADVGKKLANLIASKKSQGHSSDGYTSGVDIQQITSDAIMVADIKNKAEHLKPGNKYNILPFNVISPDDFMVQVVTLDKDFSQFNQKLQSCAHSSPLVSQKLVQGQLVLVQKPQGHWCRAEVMQIEDASLTVRLLDYGSIETVLTHTVRSAPPFCLDHSVITVHSKLAEIKPADKGWSPKLFAGADVFYCQLLDDTAILQYFELMGQLGKLCDESSEEPTSLPEKGQLVAAKYLDDWYRAKVIDTHKDKVEVFFIDYGNVSLVDKAQLREISSEIFVEFPILAVQCCLTGISKQKWTNEISKFQDQTMNVKVVQKVGNSYQIIFEEDLEDQLKNKDVPVPPPAPTHKSAEDAEKERIQRQIEELQKKLAALN
ncbi:TDRD1_4_6_7 [Acanthosepion pharaonis]|uniref:TDRD1_4_6_7 n=1 Tax=Acanthosepion pharaonis TaxID=158019 RepID=A0A812BH73_ACAPH|nr:TDRD1_4_6_7 [Sepia pharaonis]